MKGKVNGTGAAETHGTPWVVQQAGMSKSG